MQQGNSKEDAAGGRGLFGQRALAVAGFAAAAWIAYFLLASRLGLFQDDVWMYHIVRFTRDGVLHEAFDLSRAYGGEGRWATQVVMVIFTWLGSLMGGITGLYVMNWILICLTVFVAHACLRRFFSPRASFLAACFLILFPADAAKFFVVSYMAWVGSILFWCSLLLLLRRQVFLAAVVLACTFIMGEAFILPGALLPLLLVADGREELRASIRRALRFVVYYALLIGPAAILRLIFAPGRATGAFQRFDHWTLAKRVVGAVYFGMASCVASLWGRLYELWHHGDLLAWAAAAMVAAILLFVAARLRAPAPAASGTPPAVIAAIRPAWVFAFGVLAWAASYPLYGLYPPRFPPSILVGKLSNVHEQAALGMTFLVGLLLHALEGRSWRATLAPALAAAAVYLGLVAGFFVIVQERYVQEWHHQLSFWRWLPEAVALKPNSLVVVEPVGEEITRIDGGSSYDWSLPHLFRFMWRPPASWPIEPFIINRGFYDALAKTHDGRIDISGYPGMPARSFAAADATFIRAETGRFLVIDGPSGKPIPGRSPEGFPLFNESLPQRHRMALGEFQLRAANVPYLTLAANDYNGPGWSHGVAVGHRGAGTFYFLVDDADANPVRRGDRIDFEHAGSARVRQIDVAPAGDKFSIFVTVDTTLDPDRDGYPHAIHVRP